MPDRERRLDELGEDPDKQWRVLSSRHVFSSPWITVRQEAVRLPNGVEIDDYYVVEQPDFVSVFAATDEGEVIFVREYKHGIKDWVLQLPGGFSEKGEDPLDTAHRELREETGYSTELRKVLELVVDPTRTATVAHIYFGTSAIRDGTQHLDASEDIEIVLIHATELRKRLARGEFKVSSSVAAALYCLPLLGI